MNSFKYVIMIIIGLIVSANSADAMNEKKEFQKKTTLATMRLIIKKYNHKEEEKIKTVQYAEDFRPGKIERSQEEKKIQENFAVLENFLENSDRTNNALKVAYSAAFALKENTNPLIQKNVLNTMRVLMENEKTLNYGSLPSIAAKMVETTLTNPITRTETLNLWLILLDGKKKQPDAIELLKKLADKKNTPQELINDFQMLQIFQTAVKFDFFHMFDKETEQTLYTIAVDAALNGLVLQVDSETAVALLQALLAKNKGIEQAINLLKKHPNTYSYGGRGPYQDFIYYEKWANDLKEAAERTGRRLEL